MKIISIDFSFVFKEFDRIFVRQSSRLIVDQNHRQVKHLEFTNGTFRLLRVQKISFGKRKIEN